MAKLVLKDLEADVELDREAMAKIMGGRGPAQRQRKAAVSLSADANVQRFTGIFGGRPGNRYAG